MHDITQKKHFYLITGATAFALTAGIILTAMAVLGIYPFGRYSLLKMDSLHAYAPDFLEILRSLQSGESALYSWSGMLGRNLLGCLVTIASSPFNLLGILLPVRYQSDFFTILTLSKISSAAVTFSIFVERKYRCKRCETVAFSILYALNAYVTSFYFNIMWLDSVIVLPLVFLGIDLLQDHGSTGLYSGALTYAILTSYGTAFQICIFAFIYFFCTTLVSGTLDKKHLLCFLGSSALATSISAFSLCVVVDSFGNSQYFHEAFPELNIQFSPLRLIAAHFAGGFPSVRFYSDSAPNIYTGVPALLLLPAFFGSKRISCREKFAHGTFLLLTSLCFLLTVPTYLLHGLHFPVMFPHRYSYIYSFTLLMLAARVRAADERMTLRRLLCCLSIYLVVLFLAFALCPQSDTESVRLIDRFFPNASYEVGALTPGRISLAALIMNAMLAGMYALLLWLCDSARGLRFRRCMWGALLLIVCAEGYGSCLNGFGYLSTVERSWYAEELSGDMQEVTAALAEETDFYRAEFSRNRSLSDSRIYGYNGLSGLNVSSGGYAQGLQDLFQRLGMSSSFNNLRWSDPSPILSSIFAQKYMIFEDGAQTGSSSVFEYSDSFGSIDLYENPYVLPLGFAVPLSVSEWTPDATRNPIEAQNGLFEALSGETNVLEELLPVSIHAENLRIDEEPVTGRYNYALPNYLTYTDLMTNVRPRIVLRYVPSSDTHVSFTIDCPGSSRVAARVNGVTVSERSVPWGLASLNAGLVKEGDKVEIVLDLVALTEGGERELMREGEFEVHAAQLDMQRFAEGIERLKRCPLAINTYGAGNVLGEINCQQASLLWMSIPYDHNWHVSVDGEKVEPRSLFGSLLAVELPPGAHRVEFVYRTDCLIPGAVVSAGSLILVLCLGARRLRRVRHGASA